VIDVFFYAAIFYSFANGWCIDYAITAKGRIRDSGNLCGVSEGSDSLYGVTSCSRALQYQFH
jgi:hypothetical protein